ncbi:MAG: SulP family inorganic anion transporter [Terrimicrobiaceae bacterium]
MPEDDEPGGTELHSKATGCRKLIGFDPVVGLYAAILPLVIYAVLGASRHLIANPDAARHVVSQ